ncbi:helicase associated domain-containing protein, partial [Streptomyces sp. NPDC059639]|uniref:helicase associated domain-containing protein n=1 Tax=Streptomyces sp. NPDC059639 TaxID=3346891 RepID=UPI0036BB9589
LVPRADAGSGASGTEQDTDGVRVQLGMWLANVRRRAAKLTPQRRADLDALGMRW